MIIYTCLQGKLIKGGKQRDTMYIIIILAVFIAIFILVGIIQAKKRAKNTSCQKCKTRYDYDSDVSWREVSRRNVNGNGGSYYIMSKVEFDCMCHKCGTEKTFTKDFKVYSYNAQSDKAESYDLETLVKKYFA